MSTRKQTITRRDFVKASALTALASVVSLPFTGCSAKNSASDAIKEKALGKWEYSYETARGIARYRFIIRNDNSFIYVHYDPDGTKSPMFKCTYYIDDQKLVTVDGYTSAEGPDSFYFPNDGNVLHAKQSIICKPNAKLTKVVF